MDTLIHQHITQCTSETFEKYKQKIGELTVPMNLDLLAELRKSEVEEIKSDNPSFEGRLLPVKGGFLIQCNKKLPLARKKMTICHEIAHTFSFDLNYSVPKRLSQKFPFGEATCYVLARELLVPRELLENSLSKWQEYNIIRSLEIFSEDFQTSKEVMAQRLTSDTSLIKDVIFIFWRLKNEQKISLLSQELAKNFTHYWRKEYIYPMIRSKYVLDVLKNKQKKMGHEIIYGKRRTKDNVKENKLYVECEQQKNIIAAVKIENGI